MKGIASSGFGYIKRTKANREDFKQKNTKFGPTNRLLAASARTRYTTSLVVAIFNLKPTQTVGDLGRKKIFA